MKRLGPKKETLMSPPCLINSLTTGLAPQPDLRMPKPEYPASRELPWFKEELTLSWVVISHLARRGAAPVWPVVGTEHLVYLQSQMPRGSISGSHPQRVTSTYLLIFRAGTNILLVPSLGSLNILYLSA